MTSHHSSRGIARSPTKRSHLSLLYLLRSLSQSQLHARQATCQACNSWQQLQLSSSPPQQGARHTQPCQPATNHMKSTQSAAPASHNLPSPCPTPASHHHHSKLHQHNISPYIPPSQALNSCCPLTLPPRHEAAPTCCCPPSPPLAPSCAASSSTLTSCPQHQPYQHQPQACQQPCWHST